MPCSASYGYFEAWSLWLDGHSVQSACLGEWSILWLGRIGKIASAIAGTVIVVDIFGEQRMKDFGTKVLGRYGNVEYKIIAAGTALPLVLLTIIFTAIWSSFNRLAAGIDANVLGGPLVILYASAPIFGLIALSLGVFSFVSCSLLFILLLSHVLAMPRVGTILRTTSLALFCGGFHFDLLAS